MIQNLSYNKLIHKPTTPAATGAGRADEQQNHLNQSLSYYNAGNNSNTLTINSWVDISLVLERVIERSIVYFVIDNPGEMLKELIGKDIKLTLDQESTVFMAKIIPQIPNILKKGLLEARQYCYELAQYPFFWRCNDAFEDLGRPTEAVTLVNHLIAVRSQRRSANYITEHNLIKKILWKADL